MNPLSCIYISICQALLENVLHCKRQDSCLHKSEGVASDGNKSYNKTKVKRKGNYQPEQTPAWVGRQAIAAKRYIDRSDNSRGKYG